MMIDIGGQSGDGECNKTTTAGGVSGRKRARERASAASAANALVHGDGLVCQAAQPGRVALYEEDVGVAVHPFEPIPTFTKN